ncbi:MAG: tRNA (adenosine(37)-N6)-threonylcarbamoyltransferase complex transferase subunit TsaD [bacterium]|nr:tRNA (adenosine(37)-N6)-threonylcarbamoyltransferase complex transferase subunit TsaD [bacterium]
MKILAVDTSFDETSVAVTENDRILSNKISSEIEVHKLSGGVIPSVARRMHQEKIDLVIKQALIQAKLKLEDMDYFAVTYGPGLAIALEVGIQKIEKLALEYNKKIIKVNHMEGHIYSALARNSKGNPKIEYKFPLLALLVSGGHTEIVLMKDHGSYEIIGRTLDDAVGEAFDKVGRMLEIGYPGGPMIEQIAKDGNENAYPLPIPMTKTRNTDMSYSGLKTAVLYLTRKVFTEDMDPKEKAKITRDIAASFQKTAIDSLILKTKIALENISKQNEVEIKDLILAGGVAANNLLRKRFRMAFTKNHRIHFPTDKKLFCDNAGMIGVAAYHNALRNNFVTETPIQREPNLSL